MKLAEINYTSSSCNKLLRNTNIECEKVPELVIGDDCVLLQRDRERDHAVLCCYIIDDN